MPQRPEGDSVTFIIITISVPSPVQKDAQWRRERSPWKAQQEAGPTQLRWRRPRALRSRTICFPTAPSQRLFPDGMAPAERGSHRDPGIALKTY